MARLPTVGGDQDAWGTLLNAFLAVAFNADGTLNSAAARSAVGDLSAIVATTPTAGDVAMNSHKITGLANGSASTDAVAYGQLGAYESGQSAVLYVGGAGASDANSGLVRSLPLATLGAAVTKIGAGQGVIILAPNTTTAESTSSPINVDSARIKLRGVNATVTWSAVPAAGYCIRFFTTASSATLDRVATDGVTYQPASGSLTGTGVQIGDGTHPFNDFHFWNGGVQNFSVNVQYQNNAYRIHMLGFHILAGSVNLAAGVTVFGEGMTWKDSLFSGLNAGSHNVNLTAGDWAFQGCQFDDAPIIADAGGTLPTFVTLRDCHQENPALGKYYYLTAQNNGRIDVLGGRILVDDIGSAYGQGIFNSASTNTNYYSGIFVHDDVIVPGAYAHFTQPQAGASQMIDGTGPGWVCDDSWIAIGATGAPTFGASFVNVGGEYAPCRYRMTEGGQVEIQGSITGGVGLPAPAFFLPTRYRAPNTQYFTLTTGQGGPGAAYIGVKGSSAASNQGAVFAYTTPLDFGSVKIDVTVG